MGLIQCAENCKFQRDGYCFLEKCGTVASVDSVCPHYIPKSLDNRERLFEAYSTNEF